MRRSDDGQLGLPRPEQVSHAVSVVVWISALILVVALGCASQPPVARTVVHGSGSTAQVCGADFDRYFDSARECAQAPPWNGRNRIGAALDLSHPGMRVEGNGTKVFIDFDEPTLHPDSPALGITVVVDSNTGHCDSVKQD